MNAGACAKVGAASGGKPITLPKENSLGFMVIEEEHLTQEPGAKQHRGMNIHQRFTVSKISVEMWTPVPHGGTMLCWGTYRATEEMWDVALEYRK